MIKAICVVVDGSKLSGHSDLGIFNNVDASSILTWVKAVTASAANPANPGNLDDADDPCSVNTADEPESSFTMSPRTTTRPLYFWCFASNSAFFR